MSKGRLFVISGPSGSGKDTILVEVFKRLPDIKFSISTITRAIRENEVPGEKYNFTTKEEFERLIKDNELLEYNSFLGCYYGTPKTPVICAIANGEDMIVEVDVNGAAQIKNQIPDCTTVFILPPDYDTLKERLSARGTESKEKIIERLKLAENEISRATEYDYVIINDKIDKAVDDLTDVIRVDRFKTDRNITFLNNYLDK